jgi:amino acid adenylation domain-containing protein
LSSKHIFASASSAGPGYATFVEVLRRQAAENPHRIAYTFLSERGLEGQDLTFAELEQKALAIAAFLESQGLQGERVLLLLPSGLDYICAFFGCLYAGVIAIPSFPPTAGHLRRGEPWFQAVARDATPRLAFTTPEVRDRLSPELQKAGLRPVTLGEMDPGMAAKWRQPGIDAGTIAFLQYTSGSTSQPKGVMVSHGNLLHNMRVILEACGNDQDSTIVSWLPLHHDMGLIGTVLQPAYLGARAVLMSPTSFLHNPLAWLQAISRFKGRSCSAPNFAYDLCVRKIKPEQKAGLDLSSWQVAVNGAEPVRADTMKDFSDAFAQCGFRAGAFRPCYGLAESTLMVTGARSSTQPLLKSFSTPALEQGSVAEASGEDARLLVGCGGPLPQHQVMIVAAETRKPCAENEIGEVWVSGPSVAQGYWNRPEETAATFHAGLSPQEAGPFLRTGDLGFINEGQLFITGRCKDLIIIRGRNLYPQDIELTAQEAESSLRPGAGAVFALQSGEEEQLVLVQEIERHPQVKPEDVMMAVREAVFIEHGVPLHTVVLLRPGSIPRTTSGKIRRSACREMFLSDALPVAARKVFEPAAEAASGSAAQLTLDEVLQTEPGLRRELVQGWLCEQAAKLLKVDAGSGSIQGGRPLVTLGLDSLMAAEFKARIEAAVGVSLPMAQLLQGATLDDVAGEILDHLKAESKTGPFTGQSSMQGLHPLSYGQKGLWVLNRVAPNSTAYTLASAARSTNALNVTALEAAFKELMARHSALRTIFPAPEGEPLQSVLASAELHPERHFSYRDLSGSAFDLSALLKTEVQRPFVLDREPPIRFLVFRASAQEYVLMLVLHHIIADLAALETLLEEFGRLYAIHNGGEVEAVPPEKANYLDFVRWQSDLVASDEGARQLQYWSGLLAGELPILQMPGARPRTMAPEFRGASVPFHLDQELLSRLGALAQAEQATLFMVLAAVFQLLLHRVTGQPDLLLGTPASGRTRSEFARVIGYCVNPVALRSHYHPALTFKDFLGRLRQNALAAFAHQDYPFQLLVEKLHPVRDAAVPPIFQAMFVWQGVRSGSGEALAEMSLGAGNVSFQFAGLELQSVALENTASQFDFTLIMAPSVHGLSGAFKFNTDLLDEAAMRGLAQRFSVLLREAAQSPGRELGALPLLSPLERDQLAQAGAGPAPVKIAAAHVLEIFAEQVRNAPEATALVVGEQRLTFAELNARSNQFSRYLRNLGVGPEVRVGLCLNRSLEMIVALIAVWKAGGAYVPLNPRDPAERMAMLIEQSGIAAIIVHEDLVGRLPHRLPPLVLLNLDLDLIALEDDSDVEVPAVGENLAYVIYTSGSTGQPKGVMIEHRSVMNLLAGLRQTIYNHLGGRRLVVGLNAPLAFDASVKQLLTLMIGHTLCVIPEDVRRNGEELPAFAQAMGLDVLDCTPTQAQIMLESGLAERKLRLALLLGGEAVPEESWKVLSSVLSGNCFNLYGPTECTVDATCCRLDSRESPSIGRPLSGTNIYILDREMEPAPMGVFGEICIGGLNVGRGYLDNPQLTAQKFLPDPFSRVEGARMYRSGDGGRFAVDGSIEFIGRLDRQVKIRGFRIELGEIEAALAACPGVLDAAAVLHTGSGAVPRLIGYVVATGKQPAHVYREFLANKLPEYMVPAMVVEIPKMPISPNGKRNYRALPLPEMVVLERGPDFDPPRSDVEQYLVELWTQMLNVNPIGIHDNFFSLGGDSLLATRLITRIQKDYPTGVPLLALFFQQPTIAALAGHMNASRVEK